MTCASIATTEALARMAYQVEVVEMAMAPDREAGAGDDPLVDLMVEPVEQRVLAAAVEIVRLTREAR